MKKQLFLFVFFIKILTGIAQDTNQLSIFIKPMNMLGNYYQYNWENVFVVGLEYQHQVKNNNCFGIALDFYSTNLYTKEYFNILESHFGENVSDWSSIHFLSIPVFYKKQFYKNKLINPSIKFSVSNDIILFETKKYIHENVYENKKALYFDKRFFYIGIEVGNTFKILKKHPLLFALDFKFSARDFFRNTNSGLYTYMAGMKLGYGFVF